MTPYATNDPDDPNDKHFTNEHNSSLWSRTNYIDTSMVGIIPKNNKSL